MKRKKFKFMTHTPTTVGYLFVMLEAFGIISAKLKRQNHYYIIKLKFEKKVKSEVIEKLINMRL